MRRGPAETFIFLLSLCACAWEVAPLATGHLRTSAVESDGPLLFIGVFSAPGYTKRRDEVRASWQQHPLLKNSSGKDKPLIAARFVVGEPDGEDERVALAQEMKLHDDMLHLPEHRDTYENLPNKTIAFFHWFVAHDRAAFVMKLDDDTFPNLDRLVPLLLEKQRVSPYNYIGSLLWHGPVQGSGKWAEHGRYAEEEYPAYMAGSGYILSTELAKHLDEVNLKEGRLRILTNEDTTIGVFVHQENFLSITANYVHVWSNVWGCSSENYIAMNLFPGELKCMWNKMTSSASGKVDASDMCCRPLEKYGLWDPAAPTDQAGRPVSLLQLRGLRRERGYA